MTLLKSDERRICYAILIVFCLTMGEALLAFGCGCLVVMEVIDP